MPEPGEGGQDPDAAASGGDEGKTYTEEDLERIVRERNKGLEANRDEVLGELKALKDRLKRYEDVDPEKYQDLVEFKRERERMEAKEVGDWDAREEQVRKEMAAQAAKEKKQLEERLATLEDALEHQLIESVAVSAINEHKGSVKVLLPHVRSRVKMKEKDGKFTAAVVDAKGNPRIGDAEGNPMSIGQFVEELKQDPDFARNFDGSGSSGGGASRSTGSAGGKQRIAADDSDAFIQNVEKVASGEMEVEVGA